MESGKFKKKRKGFAQVSNYALTDKTLSLKAKGLYAMIESYISIPDFTLYKDFLIKQSTDGEKSFRSGWNELKDTGYLKIYKTNTPFGFVYEYELLDYPENEPICPKRTSGESTDGNSTAGKTTVGKETSKINSQENKIEKNNISSNNTKALVEIFLNTISDVVDIKTQKENYERFKLLLFNLKYEELLPIIKLETNDAISFYKACMNCYEDPAIQNPEGFVRTAIKNIMSFIEVSNKKTLNKKTNELENARMHDDTNNPIFTEEMYQKLLERRKGLQQENYDASKNPAITKEEIEAFENFRNIGSEELKLF